MVGKRKRCMPSKYNNSYHGMLYDVVLKLTIEDIEKETKTKSKKEVNILQNTAGNISAKTPLEIIDLTCQDADIFITEAVNESEVLVNEWNTIFK